MQFFYFFNLTQLKKSLVPNEISLLLKLAELEDAKDLLVEKLDNFTRRKLCLAIALMGNPEVSIAFSEDKWSFRNYIFYFISAFPLQILIINELCAGVSAECKQSLRSLLMVCIDFLFKS